LIHYRAILKILREEKKYHGNIRFINQMCTARVSKHMCLMCFCLGKHVCLTFSIKKDSFLLPALQCMHSKFLLIKTTQQALQKFHIIENRLQAPEIMIINRNLLIMNQINIQKKSSIKNYQKKNVALNIYYLISMIFAIGFGRTYRHAVANSVF
jgi:coenzyme F420-reducing hydrogenase delta subunit